MEMTLDASVHQIYKLIYSSLDYHKFSILTPPMHILLRRNSYIILVYLSRINIKFLRNFCFGYVQVNCGVGIPNSNSCSLFSEGLKSLLFYITQ